MENNQRANRHEDTPRVHPGRLLRGFSRQKQEYEPEHCNRYPKYCTIECCAFFTVDAIDNRIG